MLSTREMLALKGRCLFLGNRSRGHIDPVLDRSQVIIAALCARLAQSRVREWSCGAERTTDPCCSHHQIPVRCLEADREGSRLKVILNGIKKLLHASLRSLNATFGESRAQRRRMMT